MPEHERHWQERVVALRHFDDTVVRRHEYDTPQDAMRRQVNRDPAAQTAAHRDDTFGIHLAALFCIVVDHESVLKELLFPGFAFAFPVAAKVHEQQRPAGEMVRKVCKPGNFLSVATKVDDEGRGKNSIRSWKTHMNSGTPMATPTRIFRIELIINAV